MVFYTFGCPSTSDHLMYHDHLALRDWIGARSAPNLLVRSLRDLRGYSWVAQRLLLAVLAIHEAVDGLVLLGVVHVRIPELNVALELALGVPRARFKFGLGWELGRHQRLTGNALRAHRDAVLPKLHGFWATLPWEAP